LKAQEDDRLDRGKDQQEARGKVIGQH